MAGGSPKDNEVFNIERIRSLVELMEEQGLSEVDLRDGSQRIRLRRGITQATVTPAMQIPAVAAPMVAAAAPAPVVEAGERSEDDPNIVLIKSPMVGTYYSRPNPDAEVFVKVGDHVTADQTVCIVEAMKVFNPIPAEVSGKIIAILISDEEPVDYGKPLFKVDTSA